MPDTVASRIDQSHKVREGNDLNDHALNPQLTRDETTEVIEGLVTGWSIPEEIPQGISTIVVPDSECPAGARFGARALHTLVLRSRPRTLVVISSGPVSRPVMQSMGQVETALGSCSIDERLSARLANHLETDLDIVSELDCSGSSMQRLIPLLCQVLAPGCRFVPWIVPEKIDEPQSLIDLGSQLGKALAEEQGACVVAGLSLPQKDPSGSDSEVTGDATILRHILDPDPHLFFESSLQGKIRNTAPMLVALGQAKERHGLKGHLLEHGEVESADSQWGAASLVI